MKGRHYEARTPCIWLNTNFSHSSRQSRRHFRFCKAEGSNFADGPRARLKKPPKPLKLTKEEWRAIDEVMEHFRNRDR
jgi:hypothetical protein